MFPSRLLRIKPQPHANSRTSVKTQLAYRLCLALTPQFRARWFFAYDLGVIHESAQFSAPV